MRAGFARLLVFLRVRAGYLIAYISIFEEGFVEPNEIT
jgi:hypothetical protein